MTTFVSRKSQTFGGTTRVPGDKSISIRALILSALAGGESRISGLPASEDVFSTKRILQQLGARLSGGGENFTVQGVGNSGFKAPGTDLDFGNSGTASRLMMGVLAGEGFKATITGDASLKKRPFGRIISPLSEMGARFGKKTLPITMHGTKALKPLIYSLPVASAQLKSAVLLAGLRATGETGVIEKIPTRDHTERMLEAFGVKVQKTEIPEGRKITLAGPQKPKPIDIIIPGDISGAAFLIVAALITGSPGLVIESVGINPTRARVLDVLRKMGADITLTGQKNDSGEPVADILVKAAKLSGITTWAEDAPLLIDEFPILFVAAAFAGGRSKFRGLSELRHKETDRLNLMAEGLKANGVRVKVTGDTLVIDPGPVRGGATIDACLDHRIAMSFLVLGMGSENPVTVTGAETISTSFPGFAKVMTGLGAEIEETG